MAISTLQLPGYATPQTIDWAPLDQLGKTLAENQKRMTLADLGRGLADGTLDYRAAAGKMAGTGNLPSTLSLLQLAEAKDKLARETAASTNFATSLASLYGGSPSATAVPNVASHPTVANDSNAMPGTVGMDQRLGDRTQDFIQDNPGTSLSSGVRTPQQQAALYANRANNPNPVAPPGSSLHESGNAADIGGMTPEQRSMLPQYGLSQPVASDAPHVELAGQGGTQPAQGAPATTAGVPSSALSPRAVQLIGAMANPNLPTGQKEVAKQLLATELDQSKLPDQVKQYVFARSQDPSIGSFTDWTRANKAAGKTEVNIDQKAESGEAMEAGKAAGKRRAEMFGSAGAASKTLTNLSRMEGLLGQVQQGKIQPARMNISAWAKSLGLNDDAAKSIGLDPAGVGSAQAVQSLVNESVIGKIGAGGFPANNFSDADREFITKIFPSLGDDPAANKIRIDGARRMAQLDIDRAKAFQKYKADPTNKGKGFEDFELQWADELGKKDVFGDLRKKAEAIVGAPGTGGQQPQSAPSRVSSPDEARQLSPGTRFVTPDGREFVR
jgi:hypothetical protein